MLTIPTYELDDIPMKLDGQGRLQFCAVQQEAVYASFAIGLKANAPDDWEIVSLYLGTQELFGDTFRRFAQEIEATHGFKISDHVGEHIGEALIGAREEAREFEMGW